MKHSKYKHDMKIKILITSDAKKKVFSIG